MLYHSLSVVLWHFLISGLCCQALGVLLWPPGRPNLDLILSKGADYHWGLAVCLGLLFFLTTAWRQVWFCVCYRRGLWDPPNQGGPC